MRRPLRRRFCRRWTRRRAPLCRRRLSLRPRHRWSPRPCQALPRRFRPQRRRCFRAGSRATFHRLVVPRAKPHLPCRRFSPRWIRRGCLLFSRRPHHRSTQASFRRDFRAWLRAACHPRCLASGHLLFHRRPRARPPRCPPFCPPWCPVQCRHALRRRGHRRRRRASRPAGCAAAAKVRRCCCKGRPGRTRRCGTPSGG